MGVPGDPYDAPFEPLYEHALGGRALDFFDAHTHLGQNDPDGRKATAEEIVAGLERAGHRRALIFPMHEPDGYAAPNDAAIDAARRRPDRLVALARIDPNRGEEAVAEAERALAAGARGFKLHPRSDAFDLPHPVVERVVAIAHEARAPVLFHAGRGFPGLGDEAAALSRRYPGARLILAHAGISDLGHIGPIAAESPNVFFDTSWWLVSDLLMLYTTVPPGRILYASDMPYGAARAAATTSLRCAAEVGLDDDAVALIAGAQLARVVEGEEPIDAGPAPGAGVLGGRDLVAERGINYLGAAFQVMIRGGDPREALALGRLAFRPAATEVVAYADRLVERAQETLAVESDLIGADDFERVRAALMPVLAAQLLLGTPKAGAPG
ncbi:MAG TPA: amidohydrolase family protein [Solirubrobacteraceae bacterium]|nr:amidohydrolase family protein [Solirubrobacteraceae bacterium]